MTVQSPIMRLSGPVSISRQLPKISNLHIVIRKARDDLQIGAHGMKYATERAEQHVGALFDLRYLGLIDAKPPRQLLLR